MAGHFFSGHLPPTRESKQHFSFAEVFFFSFLLLHLHLHLLLYLLLLPIPLLLEKERDHKQGGEEGERLLRRLHIQLSAQLDGLELESTVRCLTN